MKKNPQLVILLALIAVLAVVAGTSLVRSDSSVKGETGYIHLKVNPEIEIEYNQEGIVTDVAGLNEDGRQVVKDYNNYIGKDSAKVLEDLVTEIYKKGYLEEDIENEDRKIILELEPGSVIPHEDFLLDLSETVEEVVIDIETERAGDKERISLRDAMGIAIKDAGFDLSEVDFKEEDLDQDEDKDTYELEFKKDGKEYEYTIHALTGKIIDRESSDEQDKQPSEDKQSSKQDSGSAGQNSSGQSSSGQSKPANSSSGQSSGGSSGGSSQSSPQRQAPAPAPAPAPKPARPAPQPAPKPAPQPSYDDDDWDDDDWDDDDDDDDDDD